MSVRRIEIDVARSLVGKDVRFAHEQSAGPLHRVVLASADGMVELRDMGGLFAPHLFVVVEKEVTRPPNVDVAPPLDDLPRKP